MMALGTVVRVARASGSVIIGKVQLKGIPIINERNAGAKTKPSTFVPLKIRKRGAKKVVIRPQTCATTGEVDSNFD